MPEIVAVCGKGGVGKTAISAMLGRVLLDAGVRPVLLVDGDPVGGLIAAIGETSTRNLADVRREVLAAARGAVDEDDRVRLADEVDYLLQSALLERDDYAVLAMGRREGRGCNCRVNALLRDAIDLLATPFPAMIVDAEAGIEQINRQVTQRVDRVLAVTDGSARGRETVRLIVELLGTGRVVAVGNRTDAVGTLPDGVTLAGVVPEDEAVRRLDREGTPLWALPADAPAMVAVRGIAAHLGLLGGTA